MAEGLVERQLFRRGRGRPTYRYSLSGKARKLAGNNFADLAAVLWHQVVGVQDAQLRLSLLRRIVSGLKAIYQNEIQGATIKERMESLRELLASRRIRCQVDHGPALPTITLRDCPYLELAQVDCTICEIETMLFSELLGDDLVLAECRLDGHSCCKFGPSPQGD
jgi:predicted ArsR family transcriptional regulator